VKDKPIEIILIELKDKPAAAKLPATKTKD
jgi:hypothetical protein